MTEPTPKPEAHPDAITWRGIKLQCVDRRGDVYSGHRGRPGRLFIRVWRRGKTGRYAADIHAGNVSGSAELDGTREQALDAALASVRWAVTRHDQIVGGLESYGKQLDLATPCDEEDARLAATGPASAHFAAVVSDDEPLASDAAVPDGGPAFPPDLCPVCGWPMSAQCDHGPHPEPFYKEGWFDGHAAGRASLESEIRTLKQAVADEGAANVALTNRVGLSRETELRSAVLLLLDHVDYTAGACSLTEMVGAVLPKEIIAIARKAVALERAEGTKG